MISMGSRREKRESRSFEKGEGMSVVTMTDYSRPTKTHEVYTRTLSLVTFDDTLENPVVAERAMDEVQLPDSMLLILDRDRN